MAFSQFANSKNAGGFSGILANRKPYQAPTEVDGISVDRIRKEAQGMGVSINQSIVGGSQLFGTQRMGVNMEVAKPLAAGLKKLDGINAETETMQGQLTAMKETDVRRTRSALQPQSNLFSLLGQGQGRNSLG